jgi:hypothetical protein
LACGPGFSSATSCTSRTWLSISGITRPAALPDPASPGEVRPVADGARLLSLGAVRLHGFALFDARWTTFADVEGNEFDLIDAHVSSRW